MVQVDYYWISTKQIAINLFRVRVMLFSVPGDSGQSPGSRKFLKLSSGIIHQASQVGSSCLHRDPTRRRLCLESSGKKWGSIAQYARVGLWNPGRRLYDRDAEILLILINAVQAMEFNLVAWQRWWCLTSWLLWRTCSDNNLIWLLMIIVQGNW